MDGPPPPFALEGLDHVVLLVDDMAAAERFYRERDRLHRREQRCPNMACCSCAPARP